MESFKKTSKPKRSKWRIQFGLRFIIVLTFLVAMGLSVYRRYNAYKAFDAIQGRAEYVRPEPTARGWSRLFDDSIYNVHHLSFHGILDIDDRDVSHVAKLPSIRRLSLHRTQVTDESTKHISGLTELEALSFQGTAITDKGLANFKRLKNLKSLSLRQTQVTNKGMLHLTGLTNMEELMLDGTQVDLSGIAKLGNMPKLKRLEMARSPACKDGNVWTRLSTFPSLEQVSIPWNEVSPSIEKPRLATLKQLRKLYGGSLQDYGEFPHLPMLEELKTQCSGDIHFEGLPQLRSLELSPTRWAKSTITVRQLPMLQLLRGVRGASIVATDLRLLKEVTLWGVEKIRVARVPKLQTIVLVGQAKTIVPSELEQSPRVENVSLVNSWLSPNSWRQLANARYLKHLTLSSVRLDMQAVDDLSQISQVETMYLMPKTDPKTGDGIPQKCRDLSFFRSMDRLHTLEIVDGPNEAFAMLSEVTSLTSLTLNTQYRDKTIPKDILEGICSLPKLTQLNLTSYTIDRDGAEALKRCKSLEYLDICFKAEDADISALVDVLCELKELRNLHFRTQPSEELRSSRFRAQLPPRVSEVHRIELARRLPHIESINFWTVTSESIEALSSIAYPASE